MQHPTRVNSRTPAPRPLIAPALLIALVVTTIGQVWFYPPLASWTHATATGHGWDGSGLRYFQFFRVLPVAMGVIAILAGFSIRSAARNRPITLTIVAFAWVVEVFLYVFSVAYYASVAG